MSKKIVIESNSIISLVNYYSRINNSHKLKDLIQKKIKSSDLIVIDKVKNELESFKGKNSAINFFDDISAKNTDFLLTKITKTEEWQSDTKKFIHDEPNTIEQRRREFLESADPFLILYCLHLKEKGEEVMLITEESLKDDGKLYKKIPIICKDEGVECKKIVDLLFDEYNKEIVIGVIEN
jgi:hypothetical protein